MDIVSTPWHILSSIIVFLFGAFYCINLNRWLQLSQRIILLIYVWHTIFCIIYIFYTINVGSDASGYFERGSGELKPFELGTVAVDWLVSFFTLAGLSFLGVFLCFNIIGVIGLLAFYASLNRVTRFSSKKFRILSLIIVFLPSINFWSSAIGKDAISFMSVGLILWSLLNIETHKKILFFSIFIMFLIRPHIAIAILGSLTISAIFLPRLRFSQKLFIGFVAFIGSITMMPMVANYVGLGQEFDASRIEFIIETRQGYNIDGGSSIDISSMSLIEKLFTYLFRPLPHEASGIPQLAASIDNILLLYLVSVGLIASLRPNLSKSNENRIFMWSYVILVWLMLSLTTGNLGIAVRQKWIFAPILIYLLISTLVNNENRIRIRKLQ